MVLTRRQQKEKNKENIFNDEKIMKTILDNVADNVTEILPYRLVNKNFDNKIRQKIQKDHENILIECEEGEGNYNEYEEIGENEDEEADFYCIQYIKIQYKINNRRVKHKNVESYFNFLRNTLQVSKIDKVRIRKIWVLPNEEVRKKLHRAVVYTLLRFQSPKILEGLGALCPEGCLRCWQLANNCTEYGPIQENVNSIERNVVKRFDKLIVNESLFHSLAAQCISQSSTTQQCFTILKKLINPQIQCDVLIIMLFYNVNPLPQEVIQQICVTWAPKSIILRYESKNPDEELKSWKEGKLFTEFCMDSPFRESKEDFKILMEKNIKKVEKVEVEAHGTYCQVVCLRGKSSISCGRSRKCHVITNISKLLLTDNLIINGDPDNERLFYQPLWEQMCKVGWTDEYYEKDLNLTIRFFLDISEERAWAHAEFLKFWRFDDLLGRKVDYRISEDFKYITRKFKNQDEKYIGITVIITTQGSTYTLFLEIYVREKELERARVENAVGMNEGLFAIFSRSFGED